MVYRLVSKYAMAHDGPDRVFDEPSEQAKRQPWRLVTACCGSTCWHKRRFTRHGNSKNVRFTCNNRHCDNEGGITALRDKKDGRTFDPTQGHEL